MTSAVPLEKLRSAELAEFGEGSVHVAFAPETLRLLRLSPRAAEVLSDFREGAALDDIAARRGLAHADVEACLEHIERTLANEPALSAGSTCQPARTGLPKAALMVNNYCNLRCKYCYEAQDVFSRQPRVMPESTTRAALDMLYESFGSIDELMFIGGEPALSEQVIGPACRYATSLCAQRNVPAPRFCMITNGVRMTGKMFTLIEEFGIQVTFSIDGPRDVHDLVRVKHDGSGTYDEALANLRRYASLFPDKAHVECTLTRAHREAGVTVSDLLDFSASTLGTREPHIGLAGLPAGHAWAPGGAGDPDLLQEFEQAAARTISGMVGTGPADVARLHMAVAQFRRLRSHSRKHTICGAGTSQITIDSFGNVYPCWMFAGNPDHCMGNVITDHAADSQAACIQEWLKANSKDNNPTCRRCYARYVCDGCLGNNHNVNGSMDVPDERHCAIVRAVCKVVLLKIAEAAPRARRTGQSA